MTAPRKTPPEVTEVARSLTPQSDQVQRWAVTLGRSLTARRGPLTGAAIDRIVKPDVEAMLAADPDIAGAGFVAAEGIVGADRNYMAWWQGPEADRVDAIANLSASTPGRYRDTDWYRIPLTSGRLTVTGPYVDLLCTDGFLLTYTAPVEWGRPEGPLGVAGVDIAIPSLERLLARKLAAVSATASLVNNDDRIIVTVSPQASPGDFAEPSDQRWTIGHGLSVIA
ncbi:cache domain-containing protein [Gordonia sp. (in: high G+C Gram-positive bacteria)]|uniref:cache domain-containing protein n=1 Tax=Gordonia sp. (in: high G+C Gram-positive bacteria) TaxID=84139 RepID=UPI0016907FE9|nr:cache domain-containing protein [Gordonia sp. (in: high G+C Gram-positive bacteria)]NLG46475.1 hypothetical protein [Gordonia sp. (in: high G+C Gram-positive bacteria)]